MPHPSRGGKALAPGGDTRGPGRASKDSRERTPMARDFDPGLSRYLERIDRYPLLDKKTEQRLARRARRGDRAAEHALVESHLRFVVRIALKYRGYGLRVADLIAEGNLGLLEAVRR